MAHICGNCVFHCMDFRFQKTFDSLIESLEIELGDFDRVSVAGGAGNFEQLERHLELTTKLHDAKTLVLTVHEDCGAGATRDDLIKAIGIAKETYPERTVKAFYVMLDGTWEEVS
ncbi:hypothetical protein KC614_00270 [candidate division WWE3 bacterium]|uniref:Carbonic anhydrase n=1 Tax=candidate division WWE3 bacterium TaxID=2053526 RepID=A0A955LJM2_UNCKA|nr:hypothetical protein [candidate division WWE3 bacterium]